MMYLKNVGKRALALVLALMMCVGMLSTTAFAADLDWLRCKHTNSYRVNCIGICDQLHSETWHCNDCDHDFTKNLCNHNHLGSEIKNLADGPIDGKHAYVCTECHVIISREKHSYADATCQAPKTCICGDQVGKKNPGNHVDLTTTTVAATCLHEGSETVTCACGTQISSTTLEKDANNHDDACTVKNDREFDADGHWTVRTCDAIGTKEAHVYLPGENECDVCGYKKTTEPPVEPTEPVDPTEPVECEHVYTNKYVAVGTSQHALVCDKCGHVGEAADHKGMGTHWETITEATCTTEGLRKGKCLCGAEVRETIPTTDHVVGKVLHKDATCTQNGYHTEICANCKKTIKSSIESPLNHSFTNYVSNNDATCMKDGTETAECDRCDVTDTRTVAGSKLEHDFFGELVPLNLQAHAVYCANGCGTHSEPVAHSFDITVAGHHSAVQATCQHMGIEVTQCKCGLEHYEVIEKLDHNYVDGKCTMCGKYADHECSFTVEGAVIREATCAQKGLKWYSCGVCGSSTAVEYEDWGNHAAGYRVSARVSATCEDNEKVSYVCVGCGNTYDTTIPGTATGHTPNDPVEENRVAPQIGVPGSYDSVVYCDVCGKELSRTPNTIPALFDDQVYIDDTDTPLGGGDEVELDDNAIPLAGPVTRAEFVDYLYRREGSPEAGLSTFEDVSADHEYAYAIGWGQANDIAYGVSATEFLPDELVTVGQAKLFLSRYAKLKGVEMPELAALVGLDDQDYAMNCDEILGEFFGADE